MSIIEIIGLTKDYGDHKGIFDLTFTVEEGEVFGYLGPNGAGKTTTIRHLMGFLNPDKGSSKILGLDCRSERAEIMKHLGYLPGEIAFFDGMSGMEFLNFMAEMRGLQMFLSEISLWIYLSLIQRAKSAKCLRNEAKAWNSMCFMHDPRVLFG